MEQYLDRLSKASLTVRAGVLGGIVVVLSALNYFLLVSDLDMRIESQTTQQKSLERDLAEKTALANNLNKFLQEMEQLETQLAEALSEMPEQKDIDELLTQLNDIGGKAGLSIEKIEPQAEQKDPAVSDMVARIPIKLAVTGNYHEIALFMQELGNLRRIVNVASIKLASPTVTNEKVVLKSDFVASAFRFVPKAEAAAAANAGGMKAPPKR